MLSATATADHAVFGFTLGIEIPSGLLLADSSFGGTAVENALFGAAPAHSLIVPTESGLFVSVILTDDLSSQITNGTGQSIVRLRFDVVAIPSDPLRLLGEASPSPTILFTPQGAIVPARRSLSWVAFPDGFPPVTESDLEVSPFPVTADPVPTTPPPEGGAFGAGPDEGLSSVCEYSTDLGDPATVLPPPDQIVFPAALPATPLQDAIDAYTGAGDWIVRVQPGTYVENVSVDLDDFDGTLYLFTEQGPDTVTLQARVGVPGVAPIALTITGSGTSDGNIVVGWSTAENTDTTAPAHLGWHGFRIANSGASTLADNTAVLVDGAAFSSVKFIGNWFDDNPGGTGLPPNNGGALRVQNSEDVEVIFNEFSGNVARARGAAILCTDSWVFLANNWIHGNRFLVSGSATLPRFGGGMFLERGHYTLCRNWVYENDGIRGGGIYASYLDPVFVDRPDETLLHIEACEIRDNDAYLPETCPPACPQTDPNFSYQGGGIFLGGAVGDPGYVRDLRIINCLISGNSASVADSPGFLPGPAPAEVGGGAFINLFYSNGILQPRIEGNRVVGNKAVARGAGIDAGFFFDESDPQLFPRISNNTVSGNGLDFRSGVTPIGSGVYLHAGQQLHLLITPYVPAANSIVWDNTEPTGLAVEWFGECGNQGIGPPDGWKYSVLEDYQISGSCTAAGQDLFGPNSFAVDPNLMAGSPYDAHLTEDSVSAIDLGDPSVPLFTGSDIDGDPWGIGATIDRGADEFVHLPFVRGDANGDATVNIADYVAIQNALFLAIPLPNCVLSADANDDQVFNVADAVTVLSYLFNQGPAPPAPFPGCGFDPTVPGPPNTIPFETCIGCGP